MSLGGEMVGLPFLGIFGINHQQLHSGSSFLSKRIRILPVDSGAVMPKSR